MKNVKVDSMEVVAKEYLDLKEQSAALEARMRELKDFLGPFLNQQADFCAELAGAKFTLQHIERENFKLSEAKKKLKLSILKPFMYTSSYSTIRVSNGRPK